MEQELKVGDWILPSEEGLSDPQWINWFHKDWKRLTEPLQIVEMTQNGNPMVRHEGIDAPTWYRKNVVRKIDPFVHAVQLATLENESTT